MSADLLLHLQRHQWCWGTGSRQRACEENRAQYRNKPYPDCPFLLLDVRDKRLLPAVPHWRVEKGCSVSHSQEQSPVLSPGRLDPPVVSTVLARWVLGTCELAHPACSKRLGKFSEGSRGPGLNVRNSEAVLPVIHCLLFSSSFTEVFRFITSEFENMFNS